MRACFHLNIFWVEQPLLLYLNVKGMIPDCQQICEAKIHDNYLIKTKTYVDYSDLKYDLKESGFFRLICTDFESSWNTFQNQYLGFNLICFNLNA